MFQKHISRFGVMMRPTTAIYVRTNGDSPTTVKNHLKKMMDSGIIGRIGSTKSGKWIIVNLK